MLELLAQAAPDSLVLLSPVKIILSVMLFGGWAWVAGKLDADARYHFVHRHMWGAIHLGVSSVALIVLLFTPIFIAGFLIAALFLAVSIVAYAKIRNNHVAEKDKWGTDYRTWQVKKEEKKRTQQMDASQVKLVNNDGETLEFPVGEDPYAQSFELFTQAMMFAVPRKSDRVEFLVAADTATLVVWLDGVKYPQKSPAPKVALQLVNYLKQNAGMDVKETRRKQIGRMRIDVEGFGAHDLALTTMGTTRSLSLVIAIDPDKTKDLAFSELGFTERQEKHLNQLQEKLSGVVLIASPPMQGQSTLLYEVVSMHDPYMTNVVCFERLNEKELEGVDHRKYPEGATNEQVNDQLKAILRGEPNVVVLANGLQDQAMAQIVLDFAEDIRFYIPVPSKDSLQAVQQFVVACGNLELASERLEAALSVRLVRQLCKKCRVAYKPKQDQLRRMNIPEGKGKFYKASGHLMDGDNKVPCESCLGIGYEGRTGVYEIMLFDEKSRELLAEGRVDEMRNHIRSETGMRSLQEVAFQRVIKGATDIKEVVRILSDIQGS